MNYNFTDGIRKAVAGAREASIRLRHDYVGTEHLLLGLLGDETVAAMLGKLGVTPRDVRRAIEARVKPGVAVVTSAELPYTFSSRKVLEFSMVEAREQGDDFVGTEHLLAGLMREERGVAADVLRKLGVTREPGWPLTLALRDPASSGFRVRVDDSSDRSIHEQIVAQVTEAIATSGLRPGERLPTVRQLADELEIAPGTVARAYGQLERAGIVVTEGARGTRVADRAASTLPEGDRPETLAGLLRPAAVAAFHLGASAAELRTALEVAMRGIFDRKDPPA